MEDKNNNATKNLFEFVVDSDLSVSLSFNGWLLLALAALALTPTLFKFFKSLKNLETYNEHIQTDKRA